MHLDTAGVLTKPTAIAKPGPAVLVDAQMEQQPQLSMYVGDHEQYHLSWSGAGNRYPDIAPMSADMKLTGSKVVFNGAVSKNVTTVTKDVWSSTKAWWTGTSNPLFGDLKINLVTGYGTLVMVQGGIKYLWAVEYHGGNLWWSWTLESVGGAFSYSLHGFG